MGAVGRHAHLALRIDGVSAAGRRGNGYGRNAGYSPYAGQEVDVLADWRATSWGLLRLGYGHYFPGDYVHQSLDKVPANGGTVAANWFYVQATFAF